MPPPDGDMAAQGNNSSDFVRKLYKMLEDPAYRSVVRWGNDGDSFVVLENEKFTKTILPKHFKHSNFASFVRQLNKYDFHKVRQNEETGQSPYGVGVWEFRHPEFHQNNKDNLDNIRRKAPAPRKAAANDEVFPPTQQVVLMNEQLTATQHQVQQLQEQVVHLMHSNKVLSDEVVHLRENSKTQGSFNQVVLSYLEQRDERRRNSRHSAHSSHSGHSGQFHSGGFGMLPDSTDEPAPQLRQLRDMLGAMMSGSDTTVGRELEKLNVMYQTASPPESATSAVLFNSSTSAPMPMMQDPLSDMRHLVYPVGQTAGIDPFHADHVHNIPYTRPLSTPNAMAEAPPQVTPPPPKEWGAPVWGDKKPRILLVEDDKTCARIGAKFLTQADCVVDFAYDGSEAVDKIRPNDANRYDLIFMDIIMPALDGVSATACIRVAQPNVPIIAMTSNIRTEDVQTYYQWGMNDVLAKPFTKDGMMRILKKHLASMLKNPPQGSYPEEMYARPYPTATGAGYPTPQMAPSSAGAAVKYETTPIQSPATTTSWHSPGGPMSNTTNAMEGGGYMSGPLSGGPPMVLTPGGTHRPAFHGGPMPPQMTNPPMRAMVDGMGGDDRPEKRPRLYAAGPGQGQFQQ